MVLVHCTVLSTVQYSTILCTGYICLVYCQYYPPYITVRSSILAIFLFSVLPVLSTVQYSTVFCTIAICLVYCQYVHRAVQYAFLYWLYLFSVLPVLFTVKPSTIFCTSNICLVYCQYVC